jgi:hypothetical protein
VIHAGRPHLKELGWGKWLLSELDDHGIADARGKVLFDRNDLERCVQFQQTLKERFARELAILDPKGLGSMKPNLQLTLKNAWF